MSQTMTKEQTMNKFRTSEYTLTFLVDGGKTVKVPVRAGSRAEAKALAVDHLTASNPGRRVEYIRKGR
jgi:prefoldin subunit 5